MTGARFGVASGATMPSPSQVPAYGLAGCAIAALFLVGIAVWLWLRTKREPGVGPQLAVAGLLGVAALFVTLCVAGQLHYGGSTSIDTHVSEPTCATWWEEVGSSGGVAGDFGSNCHHDAIDAIGPAIVWSLVAGVGVLLLALGLLRAGVLVRARRARRPVAAGRQERFVE